MQNETLFQNKTFRIDEYQSSSTIWNQKSLNMNKLNLVPIKI